MKIVHAISSKIKSLFQSITEKGKKYGWPIRMLAIVAVLLLATHGQSALSSDQYADGLGSYAVALVIFLFVVRGIDKLPPPDEDDQNFIRRYAPLAVLWLTSFLLLLFTLPRVDNRQLTAAQEYITDISWLLSIATFVLGVYWISPIKLPHISFNKEWFRENAFEVISVGIVLLASLGLCLYQLEQHPYPMLKDEAQLGMEGIQILQGHLTNFFNPGWATNPIWISIPYTISISIFGNTLFAIRILSVLMGTSEILLLYFLTRSMFDRWTALISAGVLVGLPVHLHFSRLGVTNIAVPMFACAIVLLTLNAIKKDRVHNYLWAGLVSGATFYTYSGARLLFVFGFFILFIHIITNRNYLRTHLLHLSVFTVAAGIVAAPILYFLYNHQDYAMALFNSSGIIQSGWLAAEPENSGRTIPVILLDQLAKSTLVYISIGAHGGFFNSPNPYLTSWVAIFLVLGMGYSLSQLTKPEYITLHFWFWSIVILGDILTVNPPSSERILGSLPPMAIFVALGLNTTVETIKRFGFFSSKFLSTLRIALLLLMTWQGASFYFGYYQQARFFEHRPEELDLAIVRSVLPPCNRANVYLLTSPITRTSYFAIRDYLVPELKIQDLTDTSALALAALPMDNGSVFFAIPENLEQLRTVASTFPGGVWTEMPRRPIEGRQPEILYYAYHYPASLADSCPAR